MKQLYIAYLLFCIILEVSRAQCPYNANISTICAKEAACLDKLKASNPLVLQSWQGCPCSGNSTQSSWLGVECMDYGGCWHVSNLSLVGLKLEGTLPGCVFNGSLGGLKALNLRNNSISGTLPTEIDSNSYLRQMQAGINRISGWLPHGFLDNGILLSLRLQNNSISGSLPSQVINALPPFEPFIIYRTRDRNNDPPGGKQLLNKSFGTKRKSAERKGSRNNFSGELPFSDQSEAINTTTLSHILLIHNMLSGTLPPWIATGSVEKLLLENNSFSGYMPSFGGNLEMLDLSQNVLSGYIPESLCGSSLIKSLRFSKNRVSGTLPPCLLQNVSSLQGPYNKISGYFPSSSSLNVEQAARNLQQVTMNDNKISGTVPLWINRLSNLNYLKSDNNKLSGTLSQDICRPGLTRLLAFSGNYLSGYLPECPGVFLQYSLYNNRFSGTLPNLVSPILNTLSIFSNEISGTIPNDLLAKRYLERVGAHANALVGTFPEILGPRIGVISLANNSLSGELPQSICSACKRLYGMLLENNNVRGNLGGFRNCSQLEFLQVSNNKLTGTIGGWISQMPKLLKLFVDRNDISGTVPQGGTGISQLANLHDVLLFDNKFEGTLPEMQSRLETLSVHNNLISGTLPTSYYKMKVKMVMSLEILTIHSNLISGSVASIGSSKLRHVHMHNNKISCRVPGMGLHNASTKGTILMGNRMEAQNRDEVPQWVFSSTRDNELLYTSGDDFMVIMIIFGTTGFVFIVFLVAVVYIFDTKEVVPLALNSLLQEIGEELNNLTGVRPEPDVGLCHALELLRLPGSVGEEEEEEEKKKKKKKMMMMMKKQREDDDVLIHSLPQTLNLKVILSAAYFKDPDLEAVVVALLLLYTVVATVWVLAIQNALARVHQETKLLYKRRIEIISNRTKPLFTESTENKAMQPSFPRFSVGVQAVAVADVQVNARVSRSPGGKRKEEEEGVITMSVNPMHPQAAQAVDGGRRSGCDRKLHGNEEEEEEEEENGNPESPPSNAAHNGNGKALAASDKPGVGNKQGGADNDNNGSAKKVHCKHFLRKTAFWAMLGFATLSVIVNLLLAPRAARITARFVEAMGCSLPIDELVEAGAPTQSSRLLLILQAFQTIVPLIVMIILDQGCLQMYLKFWRTCEDKDSFLIQRRCSPHTFTMLHTMQHRATAYDVHAAKIA
eukprot:jgi/Bigna1/66290/fgenesh1_pg.1_\